MKRPGFLLFALTLFSAPSAFAACSIPVGAAGEVIYNADYHMLQFCDDTNWVKMGGANDSRIGTLSGGKWCTTDGTVINCTTTAPLTAESDPKIGTLTAAKWCTSDGALIACEQNSPLMVEVDPQIGVLTNGKWCRVDGTSVQCIYDAPTESDPKIGTLTNAKWCTTDGALVNCTSDAPSSLWSNGSGGEIYYSGGGVGIGTSDPNNAAALDLSSTSKVFLPPRMTTTQRNAISGRPAGSMIFNTTTNQPEYYTGSVWHSFGEAISEVAPTEVVISQATGTAIGNMTARAGLAAVFDGDNSEIATDCAGGVLTPVAYAGKNYGGVGKAITKVVLQGSTDKGYATAGSNTITLSVLGKNGAPSNASDGTVLGTSGSFADESVSRTILTTGDAPYTRYTHVWVRVSSDSGSETYLAEAVFYENTSAP